MDGKLDMSKQRALAAQKVNHIPGWHPKQHSQQVEGGDPASLLCIGETSPGVLHPDVEPSVQEKHRPVGARPEKGHKNDPWNGTPLL